MIVCITPNPAIDRTYTLPTLEIGASHRVPMARVRAGGKGINVARVLHQQHEPATVLAPVGGRSGAALRADLVASGIPHALIDVAAETRQTTAIVTPEGTTNLNEVGDLLSPAEWDALVAQLGQHPASVLVCSGSLPPGAPGDLCYRIVHSTDAPVVVDVVGAHLLAAVEAGAAAVKPNREELLATVGGDDPVEAARALASRGSVTVFASLGAEGMLAVRGADVLHASLGEDLPGNPTGAGDAAVAAIASAMRAHAPLEEQLARAVAWSAAAVLEPQAGTIHDPTPLRQRVSITRLE